jgi:hypothetical protein
MLTQINGAGPFAPAPPTKHLADRFGVFGTGAHTTDRKLYAMPHILCADTYALDLLEREAHIGTRKTRCPALPFRASWATVSGSRRR